MVIFEASPCRESIFSMETTCVPSRIPRWIVSPLSRARASMNGNASRCNSIVESTILPSSSRRMPSRYWSRSASRWTNPSAWSVVRMRWAVLMGSPTRRAISVRGRRGSRTENASRTWIALRRDLSPLPLALVRVFRIVEITPLFRQSLLRVIGVPCQVVRMSRPRGNRWRTGPTEIVWGTLTRQVGRRAYCLAPPTASLTDSGIDPDLGGPSGGEDAAVHVDRCPRDVAGFIAREERHHHRDVSWVTNTTKRDPGRGVAAGVGVRRRGHVRRDPRWGDAVDRDPMRSQIDRKRACKPSEARFGSGVVRPGNLGRRAAGNGPDVHDAAPTPRDHVRGGSTAAEPATSQIDVDDAPPFIECHLGDPGRG